MKRDNCEGDRPVFILWINKNAWPAWNMDNAITDLIWTDHLLLCLAAACHECESSWRDLKTAEGKINPACFEENKGSYAKQVRQIYAASTCLLAHYIKDSFTFTASIAILCCYLDLILHHYDRNQEMNHFEDELQRPSHFFFALIFSSSISLDTTKWGKTCLVSTINHNNHLSES